MRVNGIDMPLRKVDGLLVLEDSEGSQTWTMVENATVNYGDDMAFVGGEEPQLELQVALPPGHSLRLASTEEAGEENVLVYSRLLVHLLREERERYAELEKELHVWRRTAQDLREKADAAERDQAEMLHRAWRDGASTGWMMTDTPPHEMLAMNPHQLPDEPDDGCHICGGPDH